MGLSSDLIAQFVKATRDEKKTKTAATVYGTIVYDGKPYVKLDGSDLLTPVSTTTDVTDGERVMVTIKDHTATVTGNISSPAARTDDVKEIGSKISEFEIIMADKVTTEDLEAINAAIASLKVITARLENADIINADIENLEASVADLDYVSANDVEALNAQIENLEVAFGTFTDISTEDLEAANAEIGKLKAYTADFTYVSAEVLEAMKATIKTLDVDKLSAKDAEIKYANIDFANIGEAAFKKLFSESGLIKDLVVADGTITGELVGVTLRGDLIVGNTIQADKLVVKGSDGLYYKLNFEGGTFADGEAVPTDSLHGSVITAKSVTAEKVSVTDLVAFDATIGGFNITENSIYSGVKSSADNTTRGIYMDNDGQLVVGDASNFLKYYKDTDGVYKLEISAGSIKLGGSSKTVEAALTELENIDSRVDNTELNIDNIKGIMSSLVTDANGGSLMTQTGDGWTFCMAETEDKLAKLSAALSDLEFDLGSTSDVVETLEKAVDDLGEMGNYIQIKTDDDQPYILLGQEGSDFKVVITNTDIRFLEGSSIPAYISNKSMYIQKAVIEEELQQGKFVWIARSNDNLGLVWKG